MPRGRKKTGNAQVDKVRKHFLRGGRLSPISALNQYGIFRLSSIVYILRNEGMEIKTDSIKNRNGNSYAEYHLHRAYMDRH